MARQPDPPAADPPADPDPKSDRLEQIEAEQAAQKATLDEHGGMLSKILDRLPGKPDAEPAAGDPPKPVPDAPVDLQAAVRKEIADAKERQEAEDKAKGDADWRQHVNEALEQLRPEKPPREPQTGLKGRLQKLTFGSDDR
jgi:hypothetical protein